MFEILPVAKQSLKFRRNGLAYTPRPVRQAEDAIRILARQEWPFPPLRGPVTLEAEFAFPWLKSHSRHVRAAGFTPKTSRPDGGNLRKLLEDALEGIVYENDAQVWRYADRKVYRNCARGRTTVQVSWEGGD